MADNLCFLSNNVIGFHTFKKHVNFFEYFKCQIDDDGICHISTTRNVFFTEYF